MSILQLYLTSLEPDLNQTIYSQSIGGYVSNSSVYPETTVSSLIGLYDTSFVLDMPLSGSWSEWQGVEYININSEIVKVSPISNGNISVIQRGFNNIINMHIEGDTARASSSKELFNDVFNDSYKQYRCIALKNISSPSDPSGEVIASDILVYLKQNSKDDNSIIRVALENPSHQYLSSRSTSWSAMQLVDTSLVGAGYNDNIFAESYLKITDGEAAGQGKIISSFDSSTGTFTFYNSFSIIYNYNVNVEYEILPAPAQRIKTGTVEPDTTGENVIPFFAPDEKTTMKFISVGSVIDISDLLSNGVMYIWLEREIQKGSEEFLNNSIELSIRYNIG